MRKDLNQFKNDLALSKTVTSKEVAIGVIKGAISAIPVAGGLINEALFDITRAYK